MSERGGTGSNFFAVWVLARRNLQRRRGQSLLVGLTITLSALLFFAGFGLTQQLTAPFERMFEEQRGSHFTIRFDSRIYNPGEVIAWWRAQPGVVSVTEPMAGLPLSESPRFEGKALNSLVYLAERPTGALQQDDLRAVEGDATGTPDPGEVWLPTSIAREGGIEVGDELEIATFGGQRAFQVSAVVIDPQSSAPFNNPKRIWIGEGQLPYHFALTELGQVMVAVRLANLDEAEDLWDAFVDSRGGTFSGDNADYQSLILGYTAPYSLMAAMLVGFSVLSILIALFAIHGTITSAILSDFRLIGILRAQGFRPRDVRNIYLLQYLALALVAVPLGLVIGIPLVQRGVALLLATTGSGIAGGSLLGLALATFLLFVVLVALFVALVARRAERVRPSEAIRSGADAGEKTVRSGIGVEGLARWGVPFLVAVKSLGLQRRRALLLTVSVLFATLAASLAIHLDYSFQKGSEDPSLLGFDNADVRVTRGGRRFGMRHDQLMKIFAEHAEIAAVATSDFIEGIHLVDGRPRGENLVGNLLAGDADALGLRNVEGRNPAGDDEVSIAINTARENALQLGDSFRLHLGGQSLDLRIVGIYQTLNNGARGFRIPLAAIRRANPLQEPLQYGVKLRPGADADRFIEELEGRYGEAVDAQPGDYFIRSIMDTVVTGMRFSNGFLAAVFLLAASVFIVNSTLMGIAENRRMFGILKTVGMTPGQLRASVVISVGLVSAAGLALGLLLWQFAGPIGLSVLFSGLGLVAFPLSTNLVGILVLVPAILLFCLASGWFPSARLLELDPRSLIVE